MVGIVDVASAAIAVVGWLTKSSLISAFDWSFEVEARTILGGGIFDRDSSVAALSTVLPFFVVLGSRFCCTFSLSALSGFCVRETVDIDGFGSVLLLVAMVVVGSTSRAVAVSTVVHISMSSRSNWK